MKTKFFSLVIALASFTVFENEVKSDLLGERCVLMGMIQGAFSASNNAELSLKDFAFEKLTFFVYSSPIQYFINNSKSKSS